MRLLCEFKRDSARQNRITIGFSDHDLTGVCSDYKKFETDQLGVASAIYVFLLHIAKTYGVVVLRTEMMRRLSAKENIGCFSLVWDRPYKGLPHA